jgi:mRNA interferase HigB
MRIMSRRTLREYIDSLAGRPEQAAVSAQVAAWIGRTSAARWASMADVKRDDRKASVINAERVVFNIKGNSYRLVTAVDFISGIVFIKWIGPHKDYDKIDAETVEYEP